MLYTSYFAFTRKLDPDDYCYCAITRAKPQSWFKEPYIWRQDLSPKWDYVNAFKNGEISWVEFKRNYEKQIGLPDNAEEIREDLELISQREGKPVLLLCYEKDVCHRFILGEHLGIDELRI